MATKKNVVIIGAGPAGCVCGYLLKKAGVDCIIVDFATFPREKICGGGLTPKAYELLHELMPELRYKYQGVKRFRLKMDGKTRCVVDLEKELRMVRRKDFDHELLKQYQALGGELIKASFSKYEELADGRIRVTFKSGEELLCDYLVGADGANSRVRKQLTGHYDTNTLWMEQYVPKGANEFIFEFSHRYPKGYSYRFPNIDWDIVGMGGFYSSPAEIERMGGAEWDTCRADGTPVARKYGANIPVGTVQSRKKNIILIGDAGGFANKLTYEGLYYAIATGLNAATAIIQGIDFSVANHVIFRKKRKEVFITEFVYSRLGLWLMKLGAHSPRLIKKAFEMNY